MGYVGSPAKFVNFAGRERHKAGKYEQTLHVKTPRADTSRVYPHGTRSMSCNLSPLDSMNFVGIVEARDPTSVWK